MKALNDERIGLRELPRFPDAPSMGDRSKKRGRHRNKTSVYQFEHSTLEIITQRVVERNG
jgi:hypothetical protein